MKDFDFTCKRCDGIALSDEICLHENCQNCQDVCCREIEIRFAALMEFRVEMDAIRIMFPEFIREIDKCIYDVGQKFTPKCGEGNCVCQWTFEKFHDEQNIQFGTKSEAESYEFN